MSKYNLNKYINLSEFPQISVGPCLKCKKMTRDVTKLKSIYCFKCDNEKKEHLEDIIKSISEFPDGKEWSYRQLKAIAIHIVKRKNHPNDEEFDYKESGLYDFQPDSDLDDEELANFDLIEKKDDNKSKDTIQEKKISKKAIKARLKTAIKARLKDSNKDSEYGIVAKTDKGLILINDKEEVINI
jgi:hypothetical protein